MKKVYINAYTQKNLGDDLFLYLISNRYKNKFFTISDVRYKKKYFPSNLIIKKSLIFKIINKILKMITHEHLSLLRMIKNRFDICLNLGGSIFIENNNLHFWTNNIDNNLINKNGYNFVIGSNVGPYKNPEFINLLEKKLFSNCIDVCFREEYSYNLFKTLPNTRMAPDIIFSLNTSNIKITNNKKVIISVIDCSNRDKHICKKLYNQKIIGLIQKFDSKGYEVVLMSFCKNEGDEKAIKLILEQLNQPLRKKIKKYFYNGNIKEALDIIGDSQIIVGSRFHANILGLVMNKTIIPLAYSDKMINVLKDINFKGKVFDIRNESIFDINSLTEEDIQYKIDISLHKKNAEEHFKKLDNYLKKRDDNNEET